MSKFAIGLLILAVYTTAQMAIPMVAPAMAATNTSKHMKHKRKAQKRSGFSSSWSSGQTWRATRPAGEVCPGIARSFECGTWPPPFDEDPDRKVPGRL